MDNESKIKKKIEPPFIDVLDNNYILNHKRTLNPWHRYWEADRNNAVVVFCGNKIKIIYQSNTYLKCHCEKCSWSYIRRSNNDE